MQAAAGREESGRRGMGGGLAGTVCGENVASTACVRAYKGKLLQYTAQAALAVHGMADGYTQPLAAPDAGRWHSRARLAHLRVQLVAGPAVQGVCQVADDDVKLALVLFLRAARETRGAEKMTRPARVGRGDPAASSLAGLLHLASRAGGPASVPRWRARAHQLRARVVVDEVHLVGLEGRLVVRQVGVAEVADHLHRAGGWVGGGCVLARDRPQHVPWCRAPSWDAALMSPIHAAAAGAWGPAGLPTAGQRRAALRCLRLPQRCRPSVKLPRLGNPAAAPRARSSPLAPWPDLSPCQCPP